MKLAQVYEHNLAICLPQLQSQARTAQMKLRQQIESEYFPEFAEELNLINSPR